MTCVELKTGGKKGVDLSERGSRNKNKNNNYSNQAEKGCKFCGLRDKFGHQTSCPAMKKTCNKCAQKREANWKEYHFRQARIK